MSIFWVQNAPNPGAKYTELSMKVFEGFLILCLNNLTKNRRNATV